jgi:hypothetical protein
MQEEMQGLRNQLAEATRHRPSTAAANGMPPGGEELEETNRLLKARVMELTEQLLEGHEKMAALLSSQDQAALIDKYVGSVCPGTRRH